MKKFLCIILICLMLPITSILLVGCDNKNEISDFYKKYTRIANSTSNLSLVEAIDTYDLDVNSYKIDINYSKSSKLSTLVENADSEYHYLKYFYQQLLDDSLAPLYFFGETISKSSRVGKTKTNQLFKNLSNLKQEYEDIDYYLGILITSLNATDDKMTNSLYLKRVYSQYEQAIIVASKLSAVICDVYFNDVISNSNINYSAIDYNDFSDADLGAITINTRARMYYYKSIYANIYTQLYIRNSDLSEDLVSNSAILPVYTPYSYVSGINSIENNSIDNLRMNKQEIYNYSVSLYNIQKNIDFAYKGFINATNKIAYLSINQNSSIDDINYCNTISRFVEGIAYDSYEVLRNLVSLLYL